MTQEKKPPPISVDVLAMMVFRLAHGLRKAAPGNDIAEPALDYLARYGRTGTVFRGNSAFVPDDVPAGMKPSKASEAVGTSPSACHPENVPAPAGVPVPDERGAFEVWARSYGTWNVERDDDPALGTTGYTDLTLTVAWHAIQTRAALADTPAAASDMVSVKRVDANNYCQILAALGMEEEGDPVTEVRNLQALAVTSILLDVVPGADGMGHEVYATSVEDVVETLSDLGSRLEDYQLGIAVAPQALAGHRDVAFEAVRQKFCKLQRYSFLLDDKGNVRRTPDYCGNWVEFEAVHSLFEPEAVEAAIACQASQGGD